MQDIADEAGVNKALLHYYFRSKSRLADAVFKRVAIGIFMRLSEAAGSDAEIEDKVRRIIAIYLDQLSKTPYVPAYVISELNQHPERARQFFEAVRPRERSEGIPGVPPQARQQIDACARAGTLRPSRPRQFIANSPRSASFRSPHDRCCARSSASTTGDSTRSSRSARAALPTSS